eukprot:1157327-Pelagomonas_calceolata.AAC.1
MQQTTQLHIKNTTHHTLWQAASQALQASSRLALLVFPQLLLTAPARASGFGGPGGAEGKASGLSNKEKQSGLLRMQVVGEEEAVALQTARLLQLRVRSPSFSRWHPLLSPSWCVNACGCVCVCGCVYVRCHLAHMLAVAIVFDTSLLCCLQADACAYEGGMSLRAIMHKFTVLTDWPGGIEQKGSRTCLETNRGELCPQAPLARHATTVHCHAFWAPLLSACSSSGVELMSSKKSHSPGLQQGCTVALALASHPLECVVWHSATRCPLETLA